MNTRITYDNTELFQFLESNLDKLQPYFYDSKYRMLLGERVIEKLKIWDKEIRRQKDIPLTLVVCGEFKRGKSSLINALLGEDVVTTDITTETITVNKISYGEHTNEIVLSGGKRVVLSDEELKSDKLKKVLAELSINDKIASLEIKRPIEFLKNVTIIDTPGLGDSIRDFTQEVEYALRQADAVVYVFSAMYPLSMQEQFFVKTAILPQKYTDLYLVANFSDIPENVEGCERISNVICERISDVLPDEKPLMISALDERCRQLEEKVPNEETSDYLHTNFENLLGQLDELLETKRSCVIPDRIERLLQAMLADIDVDIQVINDSLSISLDELKLKKQETEDLKISQSEDQAKINKAIDDKINIYRGKSIEWMSTFIDLLEADSKNLSGYSIDDIKRFYSVFCVEALQEALDKCTDYFVEALYDEVENISLDIAKKLSMKNEDRTISFQFGSNFQTITKGDKLYFASQLIGEGLILPFISGKMRESEIKKKAPDVIKEIKDQFPQLRTSVIPAVSERYGAMADSAKKMLSEYFFDKKTELEEQLSKSEEIARQDEDKKNEIKAAVDEISVLLQGIRDNFTSF